MRNVHELLTSKEEADHEPGKPSSLQLSPDDGKIQLNLNTVYIIMVDMYM